MKPPILLPMKPDASLPDGVKEEYSKIRSAIYSGTGVTRKNRTGKRPIYITTNDYPLVESLAILEYRKKQLLKDYAAAATPVERQELWSSMNPTMAKILQLREVLYLTPTSRSKKAVSALASGDGDGDDFDAKYGE